MMGLLVECQHVLTRAKPSLAVDQALISLARKIESFEAIAYESAAVWAGLCGLRSVREMALEAAEEENAMSRALERLLAGVNASAPARKSKSRVAWKRSVPDRAKILPDAGAVGVNLLKFVCAAKRPAVLCARGSSF